jgi:hypothetical protein
LKKISIEWLDAASYNGWIDPEESEMDGESVVTIGFLVSENDKEIVISPSVSDDGRVLTATVIPKGWIKKRRYIK